MTAKTLNWFLDEGGCSRSFQNNESSSKGAFTLKRQILSEQMLQTEYAK